MTVSTKGRYVLRVMIDLAEHAEEGYVPMKDVALRQDISLKYLEKLLPALVKGELIRGQHGKGGGYMLTRAPEHYPVSEILELIEGDLAPVACLECGTPECPRKNECRTRPMWDGLDAVVRGYLGSVTIADLMKRQ